MNPVRKFVILTVLGTIALALAIVVRIRSHILDIQILAYIAFIGGVAIIVNNLPTNGDKK